MRVWRRVLAAAYAAGAQRHWWLWLVACWLVLGVFNTMPQPWHRMGVGALLVATLLLVDGHARWQRDTFRERTAARVCPDAEQPRTAEDRP